MAVIPAEPPQQSSTTITVLLIDDDEADLNHWSDTLLNLGKNYAVLAAPERASGVPVCRDRTGLVISLLHRDEPPDDGVNDAVGY